MPDARTPIDEPPQLPSPGVRTVLSLLLFLHLFALAVVAISYGNPLTVGEASLDRRLLDVLAPYVETFNLNLGHRFRLEAPEERQIEPTARYYLTHARQNDVDFVVEITARKKDGSARMVVIPANDLWPGDRRRRYQLLANAIGSLAGNDRTAGDDSAELILPRAVAGAVLAELGAEQGSIRCQAHLLMSMEEVRSSNANKRDPFASRYYNNVLEAQALLSGGRVDLLKSSSTGEVAPVEKGP